MVFPRAGPPEGQILSRAIHPASNRTAPAATPAITRRRTEGRGASGAVAASTRSTAAENR